jgi:hypothetical protein
MTKDEALKQALEALEKWESTTNMMMALADRLGELPDDVDPRAWTHLLVYAPDDFDSWYASPYAKVLMKSIEEDYSPKRKPLEKREIMNALMSVDPETKRLAPGFEQFARAIEAAHGIKEKNT